MNCPSCQAPLPTASNFCGMCGYRVVVAAAPATPALAPAPPAAAESGDGGVGPTLIGAPPVPMEFGTADAAMDLNATLIQAPRLEMREAPAAPEPAPKAEPEPAPKVESEPEPAPKPARTPAQGMPLAIASTPSVIVDASLPSEQAPAGSLRASKSPVAVAPEPAVTTAEAPTAEAPKAEVPKAEAPKAEAPKAEAPKAEAPKAEAPKAEAPKAEAPKAEAPKAEAPKAAAGKPGEGGFRETIWFMDAIDPEKLATIEEESEDLDAPDRRQKALAEASKQTVDESVRRQFSLSADVNKTPATVITREQPRAANGAGASGGNIQTLALVGGIVALLAVAIWFFLR